MKIISDKVVDDGQEFGADEIEDFNDTWEALFSCYDQEVTRHLFTEKHKNALLLVAKHCKKNVFGGSKFQADPVNGFGMRVPAPEDLFLTAGDFAWDTNWTAGAVGTMFSRNYIGVGAKNTVAFFADTTIQLQNAVSSQKWALAQWGIADELLSGRIHGYFMTIGNRERAHINTELQQRLSQKGISPFPDMYFWGPDSPMKQGIQCKTGFGGNAAILPIGVVFVDSRRATAQATLPRPVAA